MPGALCFSVSALGVRALQLQMLSFRTLATRGMCFPFVSDKTFYFYLIVFGVMSLFHYMMSEPESEREKAEAELCNFRESAPHEPRTKTIPVVKNKKNGKASRSCDALTPPVLFGIGKVK